MTILDEALGERRLMTLREVAELLSVSRGHVYNLVSRGDLPAIKVGPNGPLRVDSDAIAALVKTWNADAAEVAS